MLRNSHLQLRCPFFHEIFLLKCRKLHIFVAYHSTYFHQLPHYLIKQQTITCIQQLPTCCLSNLPHPLNEGQHYLDFSQRRFVWSAFELCINGRRQLTCFCVLLLFSTIWLWDLSTLLHTIVNCLFSLLDHIPFDEYFWLLHSFYC